MESTITKPRVTILYEPSRRIAWCRTPTASVVFAINKALQFALLKNGNRPNDYPAMIELKE